MTSNHKLTGVIKGRTIASTGSDGAQTKIGFDDGSTMTIQTAPSNSASGRTGDKIKAVRQQDTRLDFDLEDGSTLEFTTAEEASCVLLRDKNDTLEYAD
ncbi:MAG: hypothetical protein M3Y28_02380 [Armatimonadota bacterium]|nr:hypothetical protein [Armatimonadota bacterium]